MARKISRRHLLRGMTSCGGIAIGLPLLDVMLNDNATALAAGSALPVRVGIWFWGNGLRPEHYFPAGVVDEVRAAGTPGSLQAWDPAGKQHTAPLADRGVAGACSIITGTTVQAVPEQAHHDGKNAVLTGSYEWFDGEADLGYAGPITPSFDQLAANAWEGLTPFKSLTIGVQEGAANNEPGNSGHFTSSTGRNTYISPEYSPAALFERVFMGAGSQPPDDANAMKLIEARRSILDAVMDDVDTLNRDLGAKDKMCLDQHLTAIRQLEMRLAAGFGDCPVPSEPWPDFPTIDGQQQLRDRAESMNQILALALSCDMTRAFSYQFTVFQTGHDFSQEPELNGTVPSTDPNNQVSEETSFHEAAHFPEFQDNVRIVTNFTFDNFARLLELLAAVPEGDGTLLDNCAILATSEHTEPMSHSTADFPLIIAGTACGRLKGGQWYHGNDEKVSKAGLTVLRAAGVEIERFGTAFANNDGAENDPSTTETFTELEV